MIANLPDMLGDNGKMGRGGREGGRERGREGEGEKDGEGGREGTFSVSCMN